MEAAGVEAALGPTAVGAVGVGSFAAARIMPSRAAGVLAVLATGFFLPAAPAMMDMGPASRGRMPPPASGSTALGPATALLLLSGERLFTAHSPLPAAPLTPAPAPTAAPATPRATPRATPTAAAALTAVGATLMLPPTLPLTLAAAAPPPATGASGAAASASASGAFARAACLACRAARAGAEEAISPCGDPSRSMLRSKPARHSARRAL